MGSFELINKVFDQLSAAYPRDVSLYERVAEALSKAGKCGEESVLVTTFCELYYLAYNLSPHIGRRTFTLSPLERSTAHGPR